VYGVLGFLLYATLFAAAGSLVSRSEDVSSAVTPLTMLCTLGYIIGTYGSTGLLDFGDAWMIGLTLVPFLSPFMMLGRVAAGAVEPWHLGVSIALLAIAVVVALWVAARIYAVGVLLYGSWPGWKGAWRLLRTGM
jgi:ABC-2 type transport system permease protein